MSAGRTVVQALEDAAKSTRSGYRFIEEGSGAEPFFTYAGVERGTAQFGAALQTLGLKKGERVALIVPDNQDFVFAFLGAVRAGFVPVPIYPPVGLRKLESYLENTLHIVKRSGARILVTDAAIKRLMGTVQTRATALRAVLTAGELKKVHEPLTPCHVTASDTCFLQFTSGSTSAPKGVVVSHGNIAANIEAFMRKGLAIRDGVDSGVSWLPLYHDMGLIGFMLAPLYHQNTVTFLPPALFLKRPLRWLETISRLRGTISFAPNFAYALCVKRIRDDQVAGLDLSQWRVAGCGAEPIRADNLRAFADKFAPAGFERRALLPSYGMAEATLAISLDRGADDLRTDWVDGDALAAAGRANPVASSFGGALEIVNCGRAFEGHEVAVFGSDGRDGGEVLPDRQVGELRIRGASVTTGYYDDPSLTEAAFKNGWLCTGDLGYLVDGEVFVCGRSKELIIVNGRNYYPSDLEWAASKAAGVRKGNVIAFGTRKPLSDRERVVVLFETSEASEAAREEIRKEVRKMVRQASGLTIDDVLALAPGSLPKTSSGKLKRTQARQSYEEGALSGRYTLRAGAIWGTARELARSQLSYMRHALTSGRKP